MTKPALLLEAETVEHLAQRYHCLPSDAAESDGYNLRHLTILETAGYFDASAQAPAEEEAEP